MPETRGERVIFGIGAVAIAALVALIVLQTTDRFETRDTPAAAQPVTTAPATTEAADQTPASAPTAPVTTTAPEATTAETTVAPEPGPRATSRVRLRLSAIADTWVEIRSGSADGGVLYSGILPQGSTKGFRSAQLWTSFGAASNLRARLNGKPLHLPPGTYSAVVAEHGLRGPGG